jgi:hypothetical protein
MSKVGLSMTGRERKRAGCLCLSLALAATVSTAFILCSGLREEYLRGLGESVLFIGWRGRLLPGWKWVQ